MEIKFKNFQEPKKESVGTLKSSKCLSVSFAMENLNLLSMAVLHSMTKVNSFDSTTFERVCVCVHVFEKKSSFSVQS